MQSVFIRGVEVDVQSPRPKHMTELEFIVDQLKRSFDGEAWHGPCLTEILNGIDAKTAAAHPISGAHTI
ncbi:MAG TPA: hypothetical protein VH596_11760, partial [Terriglobales bacterium]